MKEGLVKEIKIYYDERVNAMGKEITKEKYDKIIEEWKKENPDNDPFTYPPTEIKIQYLIRLDENDAMGICSLLDWDIRNNKESLEKGTHPVTGYKSSEHNEICIKRNQRWIKLLGMGERINERRV